MIVKITSISFDMANALEVRLLSGRYVSCIAVFFAYFVIIHGEDPASFNVLVVLATFKIHKELRHCVTAGLDVLCGYTQNKFALKPRGLRRI